MMGRKIAAFAALCCLTAGVVLAAEEEHGRKPGPSISEWLKSMQRKIESIVPRKSLSTGTGVAGVRGAKEDQQAKLYWKGKKSEEVVTEDELKEFQEGIDFAAKGDRKEAARELEEFMKLYPNSALIPDAKQTLELVQKEPESAAAPQQKDDHAAAAEGKERTDSKASAPAQEAMQPHA